MELETFKIYCRAFFPDCKFKDEWWTRPMTNATFNNSIRNFARWMKDYDVFESNPRYILRVWLANETECYALTEKEFINKLKQLKKEMDNAV